MLLLFFICNWLLLFYLLVYLKTKTNLMYQSAWSLAQLRLFKTNNKWEKCSAKRGSQGFEPRTLFTGQVLCSLSYTALLQFLLSGWLELCCETLSKSYFLCTGYGTCDLQISMWNYFIVGISHFFKRVK